MASDMFYGASPQLFAHAKMLREEMTPAERMLWAHLRDKKLKGIRFKAQHPISYFVADFYAHVARLVVELDGNVHDSIEQQEYDTNRTYLLEEFGLRVIRFRNEEVSLKVDEVVAQIAKYLPV